MTEEKSYVDKIKKILNSIILIKPSGCVFSRRTILREVEELESKYNALLLQELNTESELNRLRSLVAKLSPRLGDTHYPLCKIRTEITKGEAQEPVIKNKDDLQASDTRQDPFKEAIQSKVKFGGTILVTFESIEDKILNKAYINNEILYFIGYRYLRKGIVVSRKEEFLFARGDAFSKQYIEYTIEQV